MTPAAPSRGRALRGGLWAEATSHDGVARLVRCRHMAPAHVSKPSWQGGHLLLQVNCPSTGLFGGDRLELDVTVRDGAAMTLTSQAAMRIHPMVDGDQAEAVNTFRVSGEGAWLEYWPEATVLQRASHFDQRLEVRCAGGAEALLLDLVWPGRLRRGEAFAFGRFSSRVDASVDGQPVVRERGRFEPGSRSRQAWEHALHPAVQATLLLLSSRDLTPVVAELHAWELSDDCWLGATPLRSGGLAVRVLSRDLRALPALLQRVRTILYAAVERPEPSLRRLL